MLIFKRNIEEKIIKSLHKKNIIIIYGPRQAGKTTLCKKILKENKIKDGYFNCEENSVRQKFVVGEPDILRDFIKNKKIVVFDEAQTIENIGSILKVYYDKYGHISPQIIATGSSSFDLANKIIEPLTGRADEFTLLPLSIDEISNSLKLDKEDICNLLNYGLYPAVVAAKSKDEKMQEIKNISTNYLYKDIFTFESIKSPRVLEDLLKLLAYQIGQIVNISELAKSVGISRVLVEKYITLLEQAFIIKKVRSYARNNRNELKKSYKIFFIDIGIRNSLVDIKTNLEEKKDKGSIFENFVYTEILKKQQTKIFPNEIFFWRTKQGLEIDFIEKDGNDLYAYECKFSGDDRYVFTKFLKEYKNEVKSVKVLKVDDFITHRKT